MKKLISSIMLLAPTVAATPAFAEVMDKEPSSSNIWAVAVICSVLGVIAARLKPSLMIVTGLAGMLYLGGMVTEIHEKPIGNAILEEAGRGYAAQLYAAIGVVVLSHAAGFLLRKVRLKTPGDLNT